MKSRFFSLKGDIRPPEILKKNRTCGARKLSFPSRTPKWCSYSRRDPMRERVEKVVRPSRTRSLSSRPSAPGLIERQTSNFRHASLRSVCVASCPVRTNSGALATGHAARRPTSCGDGDKGRSLAPALRRLRLKSVGRGWTGNPGTFSY